MANLTSETGGSTNQMSRDFKNKLNSASSSLESKVHQAQELVVAEAKGALERASKMASATREYVQENPAKSVAIAAATGLAAGGLISLFLRRQK